MYEFDNQPIPDICAQGMSHTEATLEAAIDTYEDSVTFGNWLRLIMQGSCSTLQKRIQFETVMLNNNGVMTQRQQISFYAAHLFILSQQQDQMMFLRVLNQQLAAAGLIQVSTGIQVPSIPEACGEAVINTGVSYNMKIMTYEYLLAAVEYLENKIEVQCGDLEKDWGDALITIQRSQSILDLEIEEIARGLFTLSEEPSYDTFYSNLLEEIDGQDLAPIPSGMVVEGAYPPPHSCQETVVEAGDQILEAIEHYEESLAKRDYLSGQTTIACNASRMNLFLQSGKIMDSSIDVEAETTTVIEEFLFPYSGISSIEILVGYLYNEYNQGNKQDIQGVSEFTLIDRPVVCEALPQVLQTYDFVKETNTEYEMALTFLNFIRRKKGERCAEQEQVYDDQLKQVSSLQARMDFSYIDETISMLR